MSQTEAEPSNSVTELLGEVRSSGASPGEPHPVPLPADHDGRSTAVWRQWLLSMASDAEAALAAAIAYREMDSPGRERWLSSLELDAPEVDVPKVALYAPLLAVEQDPERRKRLILAMGGAGTRLDALGMMPPSVGRAFSGDARDGTRVFVLATPLYLHFFQVLACGVRKGVFEWVRHDPIVRSEGVPTTGSELEGVRLLTTPMKAVLDELAAAVLSHQRAGRDLPEALHVLGALLGPLGP